jgi:hypothetical protein
LKWEFAEKNRTEETFGVDAKNPPLKKGKIEVVGNSATKNGGAIPERGYSVNQKTGHPVASSDKQ